MNFNEETIDNLANLLMINLNDSERKMILDEFNSIDENINKINDIDGIGEVIPMTHPIDNFECILRDDNVIKNVDTVTLLKNATDTEDASVVVPKVVG